MAFKRVPLYKVVTLGQQYNVGEKPTVTLCTLLFPTFSVLVANPKKLLYTVANPARGLLNRKKRKKKKKVWHYMGHIHWRKDSI